MIQEDIDAGTKFAIAMIFGWMVAGLSASLLLGVIAWLTSPAK